MERGSKCMIFFAFLHFAIRNSLYSNIMLKPKQVICLEKLFFGSDVLAVLPTGYGKSLIYQILPLLLYCKEWLEGIQIQRSINECDLTSVVIVISPLNSLINDQIRKILTTGLRVSILNVNRTCDDITSDSSGDEVLCDVVELDKKERLLAGYYNILFAHPESLLSSRFGRSLVNSVVYQKNVCALVIDEAHCIIEWYVYKYVYVYKL
ncbi:Werner syndrome ATP-dependent helicase homolog [Paramuricea clavata]|uniref:DNA 3'-5' helicase n=1 Tax=Paramuricea clavata TaxID=317549 RepID=A0A7D9EFJ7_PARCT|nr:Werner syndrome ATP-dependent helicase homolog [Paramuricea clavata]